MAKIIEIFKSIQGEGKYAGTPQVFVRFFECNMHCTWCDTPHSIGDTTRNYKEMSVEDIVKEIDNIRGDCQAVSITGGEPLLQIGSVKELAAKIKRKGMAVHIDTNGTLPDALEQVIEDIDVVAMDIKLPSSTKDKAYWQEHEAFLKIAARRDVFIKTVISSDTDPAEANQAARIVHEVDPDILFILQPNTFELGNGVMRRIDECYAQAAGCLRNVRVLPQMHRLLKIR